MVEGSVSLWWKRGGPSRVGVDSSNKSRLPQPPCLRTMVEGDVVCYRNKNHRDEELTRITCSTPPQRVHNRPRRERATFGVQAIRHSSAGMAQERETRNSPQRGGYNAGVWRRRRSAALERPGPDKDAAFRAGKNAAEIGQRSSLDRPRHLLRGHIRR